MIPKKPKDKAIFILDSGAFSVWTKGDVIDIDAYIEFIKANLDIIDIAVALDVIPGKPNQLLTMQHRQEAAKQSWINYKYMLKKGIPSNQLMPVFHQGEDNKWLEKMVQKCEYVGISPANDRTTKQRIQWIENVCKPYIINNDGTAKVKFHGFAVTSLKLVQRFPWYSVDSASWLRGGISGTVDIPSMKKGKQDFLYAWKVGFGRGKEMEEPASLLCSGGTKNIMKKGHFLTLPVNKRKIVQKWLEQNEVTAEQALDSYKKRHFLNFNFVLGAEKQIARTKIIFAGGENVPSFFEEDDMIKAQQKKASYLISYLAFMKNQKIDKFRQTVQKIKGVDL